MSSVQEAMSIAAVKKYSAKFLMNQVDAITRDIKYLDGNDVSPGSIAMKVEELAEKNDIDVSYEVKMIRVKMHALESAVYELITPFQDEFRSAENDYDDLESEIEEELYNRRQSV